MKKRDILLPAIIAALLLSACGKQTESVSVTTDSVSVATDNVSADVTSEIVEKTNGIVFTDALNREVKVENPQRVVTLLGSFCDEWLLAGGSVVGTASDSFSNYDFGFDESVVDVGSHMEPDVEQIIALTPDFVIASAALDSQVELLETLENAGITVAYFEVNSFEDYRASFEILTKITDREDLYEKYGTDVAAQIDAAKTQIDGRKPTVLFIRAAASSVKIKGSEGTVGGEILADLDTVNIADANSLLEDLDMEAIIAADPDYIFVTTQGSDLDAALANVEELLISNPAWNSLQAVQNNNYYVIDKALYNSKPNARWGEAYQQLADIIYPKE
ncbi:MAG: ABC transporter substrate-binding protein [Acetatifactor sp.]|nr:ABC transporter substrate-binding protein [Acetatifactor sp.]